MPGGVVGGVVGTVHSQAQRQRELEALAALQALMQHQPGLMQAPYGLPQAPPLPRGEPARPGGFIPPLPPGAPRMGPLTPQERLAATIVDYGQAQGPQPPSPVGSFEAMRATLPPASSVPDPRVTMIQRAIEALEQFGTLPQDAAMNLPRDVAENAGGLAQLAMNPMQLPELASQGLVGGFAKSLNLSPEGEAMLPEGVQNAMAVPEAMGDYYRDAYGSLDAIMQSLRERPFSTALDAADLTDLTPQLAAAWPLFKASSPFTKWLAERGPLPGRGPVTPKEAVVRQVNAEMFMNQGNERKALANIDEVGLTGKELDKAIQAGLEGKDSYPMIMSGAHTREIEGAPQVIATPDGQRRVLEAGLTVPDSTLWYPNSTEGINTRLAGDPLAPPLISATSSGDTPHGNSTKALAVLSGLRSGMDPHMAVDLAGFPSAEKQVARIVGAEDLFKQLPFTTAAESMAAFDYWLRNAPESEVKRLMGPEGVFTEPKTFNFWRDLTGDSRFFTTDSWQGRNAGFSIYDPNTIVATKFKDKKTGLYKTKQGGWIEPEQSSFYTSEVRSPRKQEKGIPRQREINLIEDVMTHYLAPEFGLKPSEAQAAHWIGGMKMFDRMPLYHMSAPYGEQIAWRMEKAGMPPYGLGEVIPPSEWQKMVDMFRENKNRKEGTRFVFGKDKPTPW